MIRAIAIFCMTVLISMSLDSTQETCAQSIENIVGKCRLNKMLGKIFISSLIQEYCVAKVEDISSFRTRDFENRLNNSISQKYKDTEWIILAIYKIERYDNLKIIFLENTEQLHDYMQVIYNEAQDSLYVLYKLNISEIDNLLALEIFKMEYDYEVLRYCRFITMVKNSDYPVKFISCINELHMEAFYKPPPYTIYHSLKDLKVDPNINVGLPKIEREGDIINVSYNAARGDDILKIEIVFIGNKVTDYREIIIGEFPSWQIGFGHY